MSTAAVTVRLLALLPGDRGLGTRLVGTGIRLKGDFGGADVARLLACSDLKVAMDNLVKVRVGEAVRGGVAKAVTELATTPAFWAEQSRGGNVFTSGPRGGDLLDLGFLPSVAASGRIEETLQDARCEAALRFAHAMHLYASAQAAGFNTHRWSTDGAWPRVPSFSAAWALLSSDRLDSTVEDVLQSMGAHDARVGACSHVLVLSTDGSLLVHESDGAGDRMHQRTAGAAWDMLWLRRADAASVTVSGGGLVFLFHSPGWWSENGGDALPELRTLAAVHVVPPGTALPDGAELIPGPIEDGAPAAPSRRRRLVAATKKVGALVGKKRPRRVVDSDDERDDEREDSEDSDGGDSESDAGGGGAGASKAVAAAKAADAGRSDGEEEEEEEEYVVGSSGEDDSGGEEEEEEEEDAAAVVVAGAEAGRAVISRTADALRGLLDVVVTQAAIGIARERFANVRHAGRTLVPLEETRTILDTALKFAHATRGDIVDLCAWAVGQLVRGPGAGWRAEAEALVRSVLRGSEPPLPALSRSEGEAQTFYVVAHFTRSSGPVLKAVRCARGELARKLRELPAKAALVPAFPPGDEYCRSVVRARVVRSFVQQAFVSLSRLGLLCRMVAVAAVPAVPDAFAPPHDAASVLAGAVMCNRNTKAVVAAMGEQFDGDVRADNARVAAFGEEAEEAEETDDEEEEEEEGGEGGSDAGSGGGGDDRASDGTADGEEDEEEAVGSDSEDEEEAEVDEFKTAMGEAAVRVAKARAFHEKKLQDLAGANFVRARVMYAVLLTAKAAGSEGAEAAGEQVEAAMHSTGALLHYLQKNGLDRIDKKWPRMVLKRLMAEEEENGRLVEAVLQWVDAADPDAAAYRGLRPLLDAGDFVALNAARMAADSSVRATGTEVQSLKRAFMMPMFMALLETWESQLRLAVMFAASRRRLFAADPDLYRKVKRAVRAHIEEDAFGMRKRGEIEDVEQRATAVLGGAGAQNDEDVPPEAEEIRSRIREIAEEAREVRADLLAGGDDAEAEEGAAFAKAKAAFERTAGLIADAQAEFEEFIPVQDMPDDGAPGTAQAGGGASAARADDAEEADERPAKREKTGVYLGVQDRIGLFLHGPNLWGRAVPLDDEVGGAAGAGGGAGTASADSVLAALDGAGGDAAGDAIDVDADVDV